MADTVASLVCLSVVPVWEWSCGEHIHGSVLQQVLYWVHQHAERFQALNHSKWWVTRLCYFCLSVPRKHLTTFQIFNIKKKSSPLQVISIPVWRRSSCGTVNSWGRTPPSSSSTLCSSSAASTLASPQLSSTGSFPSPTSGAAPKPTRTTPRPASCASTRQNPFTRQSQVPIWLRLKLKWLYCNIIEFRF